MAESHQDSPSGPLGQGAKRDLRKHLRFRIDDASTKLYLKGFLTSLGLGRVNKARAAINLAEGGTMLLTGEMIPVGTRVIVRIDLERFGDVIEAPGEVRWCAQSGKSDQDYYAGIQFTGLSPADAKKIARMRDWFTSPEYKTRTTTRRKVRQDRDNPSG